jgi:hypothetical protein
LDSTFEELGGRNQYLRRLVDRESKLWSAFNPSIAVDNKGNYSVAIRSSNYVILEHGELSVTTGDKITNHVWFADLDDELKIKEESLRKLNFSAAAIDKDIKVVRGVEDPKLMWRGGWVFMGVFLERDVPVARNCVCYVDKNAMNVTKVELIPGIETRRPEKNWMTCAKQPTNFDYVYDGNGVVIGDRVIHRLRDNKLLNKLRGNGQLLEYNNGTYLGLMHSLEITKQTKFSQTRFAMLNHVLKRYSHYFVRFDEDGWIIEISKPFCFQGPGIEFANGIVERGDEYVISYGKEDISSHLGVISKKVVGQLMESVD